MSNFTGPDTAGDSPVPDILEGKTFYQDPKAEPVIKDESRIVGIVTAELLNVRTHPSKDPDNIIGTISKDTQVLVEEAGPDFYKILSKAGDEGYCMRDFITLRGE